MQTSKRTIMIKIEYNFKESVIPPVVKATNPSHGELKRRANADYFN